jgi:hypothetical protein
LPGAPLGRLGDDLDLAQYGLGLGFFHGVVKVAIGPRLLPAALLQPHEQRGPVDAHGLGGVLQGVAVPDRAQHRLLDVRRQAAASPSGHVWLTPKKKFIV